MCPDKFVDPEEYTYDAAGNIVCYEGKPLAVKTNSGWNPVVHGLPEPVICGTCQAVHQATDRTCALDLRRSIVTNVRRALGVPEFVLHATIADDASWNNPPKL